MPAGRAPLRHSLESSRGNRETGQSRATAGRLWATPMRPQRERSSPDRLLRFGHFSHEPVDNRPRFCLDGRSDDRQARRERDAAPARSRRRAGRPRRVLGATPQAIAADGPASARSPASGPSRPFRRAAGGLYRPGRAAARSTPKTAPSALTSGCGWSPGNGSCKSTGATWAPPCATPAARSRSTEGAAASQLRLAGSPVTGAVHDREPGGRPRRASASAPGCAQWHGPDGPRDPGPAAFRGAYPTAKPPRCSGSRRRPRTTATSALSGRLRDLLERIPGFLDKP